MNRLMRIPIIVTPFSQRQRNGWMVTFADMMALLLTFFIIMLSYSTVDSGKYDDVMSSLEQAFGASVQPSAERQAGVGVIERAQPQPKMIEVIKTLEPDVVDIMQASMAEEIKQGTLEVERQQGKLLIRFPEHAAFPSGSADINQHFLPVVDRLAKSISETTGEIVISGHTDDLPINNGRYRSNWDLSAARAVSVIHALLQNTRIDPRRVVALGHADTKPLSFDADKASRKVNRRVEIVVELEQ